jgi:N-acetyl sugar amidotransferase
MRYCLRCVYPENHPLNIVFDEQGVCSGCLVHEEKDIIDWNEREDKLRKIFDSFRSTSGKIFDCIIPVNGARDSYFIVHIVKNVFKMNPLLVSYNKHYNTGRGIRNLAYLRTLFDCDAVLETVSPIKVKKITRATIRTLGSIYWHCLAGATVLPVHTAVKLKIPLIVWGAHQGCDQVGMFSHLDEVEMTRKYRKEHDLMKYEAEDLKAVCSELNEGDIEPYRYPHDKEVQAVGVRGIYLNNYIRWDSKAQHEKMIELYKYETASQQRTFDNYNDVDCFHYSGLHDYIKFIKYGYGKVTDHVCREIRLKRLTREEGIDLVAKYSQVYPNDINLFLQWIDMTENAFFSYIDNFRDKNIWNKNETGRWSLKDSVVNHRDDNGVELVRLEKKNDCNFVISESRDKLFNEKEYVLVGRGYVGI